MSITLRQFHEATAASLQFELDERQWWQEAVGCGLVSPDQAEGYIRASNAIIETKRYILATTSDNR